MSKNRGNKQSSTSVKETNVSKDKQEAMDQNTQETTQNQEVTESQNEIQSNEVTQTEQTEQVEKKEEVTEVPQVKEEEKVVSKTKTEGFTPVYKVELDLNSYAEAMDKKKAIVPEEGGKWQYSLYTTVKSILNAKTQEEFNAEWNTLLLFFNKNKEGIFNEKFIYRFPEQWPGSNNEFTSFRRIVYLIIQTADPKARKKGMAEINMTLVTEGLNEAQRNRLLAFYGV